MRPELFIIFYFDTFNLTISASCKTLETLRCAFKMPEKEKLIGVQHITGLTAHIFRHNYCTMLYPA